MAMYEVLWTATGGLHVTMYLAAVNQSCWKELGCCQHHLSSLSDISETNISSLTVSPTHLFLSALGTSPFSLYTYIHALFGSS